MWKSKRFGEVSIVLFLFMLMFLGISIKTYAQETNSNPIESQTTLTTETSESQSVTSSDDTEQSVESVEESSSEKQLNLPNTAKATAEYGSELLTNVSITDSGNNPIHRIKSSDKVKVNYSFYLPDEAQAGDMLVFELPPILQMVNYNDFPLLSQNGSEIGHAKIDRQTNKVTVTFNQYVTDHNSISGQFFFWVKLASDQTLEGVNPMPLPVNGTTSDLNLTVSKMNGATTGITNPTTIFKSGKFDSIDPKKVNWTITLNNSGQNLLTPIIYDQLGQGQALLPETFNVNYRDADKKNIKKYSLPSQIEGVLTRVEVTPNGFALFLENLGSYSLQNGYVSVVINYSTRVTDSSIKYVNSASTFDEDGALQSRNASLTNYENGGIGNGDVNQAIDSITDKIDEVESIDLNELTDFSAQNLIVAKEKAQTLVDSETATASDLEAATDTLINQLVTTEEIVQPTDIQELQAIIDQNDELREEDYTPETWTPWINKKTEGVSLIQLAKETPKAVSRNEIVTLTQELKTARANLLEVTMPSETSESASTSETTSTETTKSTQNSSSSSEFKSKDEHNSQYLLKIGETRSTSLIIFGALLLSFVFWFAVKRNKLKNH